METPVGAGNTALEYVAVVLVYAGLFAVMRYAHPAVELNFRTSFRVLYIGWGFGTFVGNYAFYQLGIMSFLPWLNNAIHTFGWIGLCLGFLYAGSYRRKLLEQCVLFAVFSFVVKLVEHDVLGRGISIISSGFQATQRISSEASLQLILRGESI